MTKSALTMTKSKAGIGLIEGDEGLETAAILGSPSPLGITAMGTFPLSPIAFGQTRPRHLDETLTLRPKKTRNSIEELESRPEIEIAATALSFPGALVVDGALMPRGGWTSLRDTAAQQGTPRVGNADGSAEPMGTRSRAMFMAAFAARRR